jgi:hypothetical protein
MRRTAGVWRGLLALAALVLALPAHADWTQVEAIPASQLFSLFTNGDTLAAGADTTVHVSTDGGTTWQHSTKPAAGVFGITAVRVLNHRLYAGTFGQGVFTSDDLGQSWQAFNQGLVGGPSDAQLDVVDLEPRGDTLYAATAGAGVYLRRLRPLGNWQHTGTVFAPEQSDNVSSVALGGTRLIACAGPNGLLFTNDPGQVDWTESHMDNVGIHAGLSGFNAILTGSGWVVGTNFGVFRSVAGQEPWTPVGLGLGTLNWTAFTAQGGQLFGVFDIAPGAVIEQSSDGGVTWQDFEFFPGVFAIDIGLSHGQLYAARGDGLWRREQPPLAVPPPVSARLSFARTGPQPFTDRVSFRFELPEPGPVTIELFDVQGRRTGVQATSAWPAGPSEVSLDTQRLSPGIYAARLRAGNAHAELRLVHTR